MVKEIFRLASSLAVLAAVIIGVKYSEKLIEKFKGEDKENIIDV